MDQKRKQRRKRKRDDINTSAWMDTYADTITLLLTFFILLYSFSTTDNERLKLIAAALKGEITGVPTKLKDVPNIDKKDSEQGIGEKSPYDVLVDEVTEIINKNALTDVVKIREEDAGVVLQLSDSILFDLGQAEMKSDSTAVLDVISNILPNISNEIMVQGHTDNVPISSAKYKSNWELSTARAVNVIRYFIEVKGFNPTRFSATGYGEYRPLVDNSTDENRAINRRVDILIVQKKDITGE
ncbi:OmpA family protein [Clostridium sp. D53t1_180928_C8]|uniref:OmpA/MotB family protein n=1 Tax=Clostridium sp. D53t1_180928_C8 TaxID=2787101 RepID=UPI0018A885F4|nr:OmpA family protein [Clostridium sp. D53t1_180928_C8]